MLKREITFKVILLKRFCWCFGRIQANPFRFGSTGRHQGLKQWAKFSAKKKAIVFMSQQKPIYLKSWVSFICLYFNLTFKDTWLFIINQTNETISFNRRKNNSKIEKVLTFN